MIKIKKRGEAYNYMFGRYVKYKVFDVNDGDKHIGELGLFVANVKSFTENTDGDGEELLDECDPDVYNAIRLDLAMQYDNVIVINNFQIFEKYRHNEYGRRALRAIEDYIFRYYTTNYKTCCMCAQIVPKHYKNVEEDVAVDRLTNFYMENDYVLVGYTYGGSPLVFKCIWS